MLAVLRGGGDAIELIDEFVLLTPQEAEQWTMSVPRDMVEALAALDEQGVKATSEKLAEATVEELGWSAADFDPMLRELATLARRAIATHKSMYLWNCL